MNQFLNGVVRSMVETFHLPEPIVEIGSYQVEGQENVANLRSFFPNKDYLGVDKRSGPGVDQVGDVENLPFEDASIGTVLSISTFEHVPRFWRGFEEIRRVLRPDGAFLVSCPFFFRIHHYPSDYWRFTPEAFDVLLEDYASKILGWHGTKHRPNHVWALAMREQATPVTEAMFDAYRDRLAKYAHQPLATSRKIRYRLAQLLCGRGPFASYLDQNRWETTFQPAAVSPSTNQPRRRSA